MSYCTPAKGNFSSILAQSQMKKVCRNGLASHAEVLRASTGVPPSREFNSHLFAFGQEKIGYKKAGRSEGSLSKTPLKMIMKGRRIALSPGHNALKFAMCNAR